MKIELLNAQHCRTDFDCGHPALNQFLQQYATQYSKRGLARTHILQNPDQPQQIIGYYTLSNLHLTSEEIIAKGYPQMGIPAILIGRLAVDSRFQGLGYAKYLLSHALRTIKKVAQVIGVAFVVIDAKNESLANYYQQFGFIRTSRAFRLVMEVAKI